uniref:Uncharacterized protein n=1 Tax=Arundo donax TaxID=35708 RepID=A0A0A9F2C2_ARUDO
MRERAGVRCGRRSRITASSVGSGGLAVVRLPRGFVN